MFTIEQTNDLHARLGSARTFPAYVLALKGLGVERYDSYLSDGHSEYFGRDGHTVVSHLRTRRFPSLKPVNARCSFSTCVGTSGARQTT